MSIVSPAPPAAGDAFSVHTDCIVVGRAGGGGEKRVPHWRPPGSTLTGLETVQGRPLHPFQLHRTVKEE